MTTGELVIGLGMLAATIALVGATIMLAVVTRQLSKSAERQTKLIERQTEIQKENQERAVDRDKPNLLLRQKGQSVGRVTEDGHTDKQFDGFTITNAGAVDVTITGVAAVFAVPAGDPGVPSAQSLQLAPREWMGFSIEGDDIPVKLKPGDIATFMFDSNDLGRIGRPYQWRCQDALGNTHQAEGWWMRSLDCLTFMELGDEFTEPDSRFQMWSISRRE
ncbi:MAG: hypothetical protein OXH94_07775 [Rhodospirillales bacterium]|nr:hypothetical protein [Rhodospirillales bacterium]